MDKIPLFEKLKGCRNILLAGAGGGYDIFSGLPLYFRLKELGAEVHLANYSFSQLAYAEPVVAGSCAVEVGPDTEGPDYFPEKYLSQWLEGQPVFAFKKTGVEPLREAYEWLVDKFDIDAIVLVDGGTDSLMRGDEDGLGTPTEDLCSIAAVNGLDCPVKLLTCIGFGVDTFHGVCHHYFLEAVAALAKSGHFLGTFSLLPQHSEAEKLRKVAEYVFTRMPHHISIVLSSILNATEGEFGDFHATTRTKGSELYINPLMSIYWTFELEGVAERCLYIDSLEGTQIEGEVTSQIMRARSRVKHRPWKDLPVENGDCKLCERNWISSLQRLHFGKEIRGPKTPYHRILILTSE